MLATPVTTTGPSQSERLTSLALWGCRVAAVVVCVVFALASWWTQPGPRYYSRVLGAYVRIAPGEPNQFFIHAPQRSIDFTRLGIVHIDVGYAVGVTLPDGRQIGFRYDPSPAPSQSNELAILVILAGGVLWVLGHFTLFATVLRHARAFHAERTIFLYHALSAAVVAVAAAAIVIWNFELRAGAVGLMAIHAIYSLSFLELWSLSEGGYSLAILRELSGSAGSVRLQGDPMQALGGRKVRSRIESLGRLGLVRTAVDDQIELTFLGRAVGRTQAALRSMVNINPSV